MATHGIKRVWLALIDDDQKIIKGDNGLSADGLFVVDDKNLGIQKAEISNMEGAASKVYGSDTVVATNYAQGLADVALTFTQLPMNVKYKASGFVQDDVGGWHNSGKKPNLAMLLQSTQFDDKADIYWGFPCGTLAFTSSSMQTDTDSRQNVYDEGTFTAKSANVYDGATFGVYSSADSKFNKDKLITLVMGGYTATPAG